MENKPVTEMEICQDGDFIMVHSPAPDGEWNLQAWFNVNHVELFREVTSAYALMHQNKVGVFITQHPIDIKTEGGNVSVWLKASMLRLKVAEFNSYDCVRIREAVESFEPMTW